MLKAQKRYPSTALVTTQENFYHQYVLAETVVRHHSGNNKHLKMCLLIESKAYPISIFSIPVVHNDQWTTKVSKLSLFIWLRNALLSSILWDIQLLYIKTLSNKEFRTLECIQQPILASIFLSGRSEILDA